SVLPAARPPVQAPPVQSATAEPVIAPATKMPSRPRLIRPLFSVRHSPRLTNRKGVPTRIAPATRASKKVATSSSPILHLGVACLCRAFCQCNAPLVDPPHHRFPDQQIGE